MFDIKRVWKGNGDLKFKLESVVWLESKEERVCRIVMLSTGCFSVPHKITSCCSYEPLQLQFFITLPHVEKSLCINIIIDDVVENLDLNINMKISHL
jgi:hypothetical protein